MAMSKESMIKVATALIGNAAVRKTILGEYSDGTPRSFADCLDGEVFSPKQRAKYIESKSDEKKKKKKKKKSKIVL